MKPLWKPHPGAQSYALSIDDSCFEILYGGARGGGKTDAGIVWLLKGTVDPKFTGICIRRNHTDLRQWIDRAMQLYPNAKVSGKPSIFEFPNGAKIYTGHLKDADSYSQFQGWEIQRILLEEVGIAVGCFCFEFFYTTGIGFYNVFHIFTPIEEPL